MLAKAELFTEDIQEDKKKKNTKKKDNNEDIAIIISDEETCEVKRSKLWGTRSFRTSKNWKRKMLLKEEEENDDNKIITTVEISDYETKWQNLRKLLKLSEDLNKISVVERNSNRD